MFTAKRAFNLRPLALMWKHAPTLLIAAGLLLLPGCLRVVRQETPYYVKGPRQVEPPDGFLPAGTKVMVFGEKDSYSRILTFDGIAAHVWERDLVTLSEWSKERQQAENGE
ncbi:MAG: hypothetical protein ACE5I3_12705 [Phycisphaerae bacterium]